ncbi:hypothetical protein [Motilibacter aurantiacus]|uniref:hypothetical protein n=1 Tax=Motilibacter aurantiacus TaxID=2714955 RepID=UPI00140AC36D|nr:hypothetical protein [Motilibacter aurantiacus]NHC43871.1 hypothetical protein [Motilibacter aurantiacus]
MLAGAFDPATTGRLLVSSPSMGWGWLQNGSYDVLPNGGQCASPRQWVRVAPVTGFLALACEGALAVGRLDSGFSTKYPFFFPLKNLEGLAPDATGTWSPDGDTLWFSAPKSLSHTEYPGTVAIAGCPGSAVCEAEPPMDTQLDVRRLAVAAGTPPLPVTRSLHASEGVPAIVTGPVPDVSTPTGAVGQWQPDGALVLSWSNPARLLTGVRVTRTDGPGRPAVLVYEGKGDSFRDIGVQAGTTYSYAITGLGIDGAEHGPLNLVVPGLQVKVSATVRAAGTPSVVLGLPAPRSYVSYEVLQARSGAPLRPVAHVPAKTRRTTLAAPALGGSPGVVLRLAVRGIDRAGGSGPLTSVQVQMPYDDRQARRSSGWARVRDPASYRGTLSVSRAPGARLTWSVTAKRLELKGLVGPRQGVLLVSVDGRDVARVSLRARTRRADTVLWRSSTLPHGRRTRRRWLRSRSRRRADVTSVASGGDDQGSAQGGGTASLFVLPPWAPPGRPIG